MTTIDHQDQDDCVLGHPLTRFAPTEIDRIYPSRRPRFPDAVDFLPPICFHPHGRPHRLFPVDIQPWRKSSAMDVRTRLFRLLKGAAVASGAVLLSGLTAVPAGAAGQAYLHVRSCANGPAGSAACQAILALPAGAGPAFVGTSPAGYNPPDLQSAYALPSATAGAGQTVAIVDAYNDPNAESDLGVYRSQFGIAACTTANGCFRKVNQAGGTKYPKNNGGWAQEISLDLDMVSAVCPNCHILLVEASSNSFANLSAAVDEAAALGATEISNSYGGSEFSSETGDDSHFNHPGIAITVSSGDGGYGVQFPAASQYVTSVGGTSLSKASNTRGWTETVWSTSSTEGAGSGCSAYDPQPSWQSSVSNITAAPASCAKRAVADVSAVADPYTGVSVYDSYSYQGQSGWLVF